jgi:hypothetical protein
MMIGTILVITAVTKGAYYILNIHWELYKLNFFSTNFLEFIIASLVFSKFA